jgi:sec-independent protein translocase protein TatA
MTHPILLSLGAPEIILIVLVLLLLFGGKKIPELMRGLGQGMKEFKKAAKEDDRPAGSDDSNSAKKDAN